MILTGTKKIEQSVKIKASYARVQESAPRSASRGGRAWRSTRMCIEKRAPRNARLPNERISYLVARAHP